MLTALMLLLFLDSPSRSTTISAVCAANSPVKQYAPAYPPEASPQLSETRKVRATPLKVQVAAASVEAPLL
jgi:hypothetical protein